MQTVAESHNLNARLLRFRSDAEQEDPCSLAEDLIAAHRYGDARGVAVSAQTDDGPLDARLLVLEGRAWMLDRDLVRAQAALVKAAKRDPGSLDAYRWLGYVLLERGDAVRALRALERASSIAPGDAEAKRLLALAHGRVQAMSTPPPPMAPLSSVLPAAPAPAPTPVPMPTAPPARARSSPGTRPSPVAARVPTPVDLPLPPSRPRSEPGVRGAPMAVASRAPSPVNLPAPAPLPLPRSEPGVRGAPSQPATHDYTPPRLRAPRDTDDDDTTSAFRREVAFDDMSEGALDAPPSASSAGAEVAPWSTTASGARAAPVTTGAGRTPAPPAPTTPMGLGAPSQAGARTAPGTLRSGTTPAELPSPAAPAPWGQAASASSAGAIPSLTRRTVTLGFGSPLPPAPSSSSGIPAPPAYSTSASGTLSSPGRTRSPFADEEPRSPSIPGLTRTPTTSSGSVRPPALAGLHTPEPGTISPWHAPATAPLPGARALHEDDAVDVELDEPMTTSAPADTTPGVGAAPEPVPGLPPGMWDGHSVMAAWPTEDGLHEDRQHSEPPPLAGELPPPAPDLTLGEDAGVPDDPERIVAMLQAHGLIEAPQAQPPVWPSQLEVPITGTRVRGAMTAVWISTLVLCGGGWLGWQQWVNHRHTQAHALVLQARSAAWNGDYATLLDAERGLRKARELHPRSSEVPTLDLFVQAVRVVENGNREPSGLRAALARAEKLHADAAYVSVARALLAAYTGATSELTTLLPTAQKASSSAPELGYLVGRLEQRLGQPQATERLQAAVTAAPELLPASLALAEGEHERGDDQAALGRLDAILARHPDHLRVQLFRTLLRADTDDPAAVLKNLDGLSKRVRDGAPVDRILWALSRAHVLRRTGDASAAGSALREALAAGTSEAGLLALVADEALRAGELGTAQQAASNAVAVAPSVAPYRVLLARVLLARGDGLRVLELTSTLDASAPELVAMRARAALQTGQRDALTAALGALPEAKSDGGLELLALRLRLRAALEPSSRLLSDAQSLLRRAPGDPEALRAVTEVALALRAAPEARSAAEQLVKVAPDDPEAHHWLGRARRMAGDAAAAEQSLRRALELSPGFAGALQSLASLLLDVGKYAEADVVYQELATRQVVTGRVGRAEALLGLGRVQDASVQLTGLSEAQRGMPAVREVETRVLLAQRKPGDAVAVLRPLLEGDDVRPSVLALQGAALYAIDQVDSAAGAYDAALERDAELPEALLGRAEVHLRAERAKDALELLQKAGESLKARLRPPQMHARYLSLLGHAYVQRGRREDLEPAKDALRRATQMPGVPAEAFFWLGEALGGRKTPEAAAALKHYLELEPEGAYASRAKRALGPLL